MGLFSPYCSRSPRRVCALTVIAFVLGALTTFVAFRLRLVDMQLFRADVWDASQRVECSENCWITLSLEKARSGLVESFSLVIEPITSPVLVNTSLLNASRVDVFDSDGQRIVPDRGDWTVNMSRELRSAHFVYVAIGEEMRFSIPVTSRVNDATSGVTLDLDTDLYHLSAGEHYIAVYRWFSGAGYFTVTDAESGKVIPDWQFAKLAGAELVSSYGSSPVVLQIPL